MRRSLPWGYAMTVERPLRPAATEELEDTLTFALRFKGCKRWDGAGPMISAIIAAESLRMTLEEAGYVVMKKPEAPPPQAPAPYR